MTKTIDCPSAGERDVAVLYLAGKLPDGEAQTFEAHYFACEDCWRDVQRGSELRASFGKSAVVPAARATRPRRTWLPLAAAAMIAFLGVGVWQLTRQRNEESARPVLRGAGAEVLDLEIKTGPRGGIDLTWPPHSEAASYEIQVLASDGASVWKTDVVEPRLSIGPDVLPSPGAGQTYLVRVQALDSMGQELATSKLTPLPKP